MAGDQVRVRGALPRALARVCLVPDAHAGDRMGRSVIDADDTQVHLGRRARGIPRHRTSVPPEPVEPVHDLRVLGDDHHDHHRVRRHRAEQRGRAGPDGLRRADGQQRVSIRSDAGHGAHRQHQLVGCGVSEADGRGQRVLRVSTDPGAAAA